MRINLNADLGEELGDDAAMLALVGSANIACAAHAGTPDTMRTTVREAVARDVSLGAHPGYPDREGFGRRALPLTTAELENQLAVQIGALMGIAALEGQRVTHVKPHGALNNLACADRALANTICRSVRALDRTLILLAPACSQLVAAGHAAGLQVIEEIFADRAYQPNGELMPRSQPGAVLHESGDCVRHVLAMIEAGELIAIDGTQLPTPIGSVCVHGDNPGAVAIAAAVRDALSGAGHTLVPLTAFA